MIRSFIAIDIPKEIKNKIAKIQMELQQILPKVSWVNPPNIHLTLKFLGDVASNRIPSITGAIRHTVQNQVPFNMKLSSISAFKNFSYPTILWIGISTDPAPIVKLAKNLNSSLNCFGFPQESRKFIPHLTIARIRNNISLTKFASHFDAYNNINHTPVSVKQISLIKSKITSEGAIYKKLQTIQFGIR